MVGVEMVEQAIEDAKVNAQLNGQSHTCNGCHGYCPRLKLYIVMSYENSIQASETTSPLMR